MSMDLDEKLVCAAREGDREAFSRLIVQYQEMVYALCYRITGRRHDAEDLAHDTFVQAYVKLGTLRETARFAPWLRSLALNLARMWYRRQREESLGEMEVAASPVVEGVRPNVPGCSRASAGCRRRIASPWCCITWKGCRVRGWRHSWALCRGRC